MSGNGVLRLVRLASERGAREDATTEAFAELVRNEPAARRVFLGLLERVGVEVEARDEVHIGTQVSRADPEPGRVRGCADLVLSTRSPSQHVVIEVKTGSGLSATGSADENQVEFYHRVFDSLPGKVQVVLLAHGYFPGLSESTTQITWQAVHNTLLRVEDESLWIKRFVEALRELGLATQLTIEGVMSVMPWVAFKKGFVAALDDVYKRIDGSRPIEGLVRPKRLELCDHHGRLGYYFLVEGGGNASVFLGLYYGEETEETALPDLYWFMELARGGSASAALDQQDEVIKTALDRLNEDKNDIGTWAFEPGGYEAICCTASLLDIVREDDPREEIYKFFSSRFEQAKASGVADIFMKAATLA